MLAIIITIMVGTNLLLAAIAYWSLQTLVIRDLKGKVSPILYLAGMLAAATIEPHHIGVGLALSCYVFVAAMWIVPDRRVARQVREQGIPH